MADVVQFVPRTELDADENLRDFVALCRSQLTAFGFTLPFDEPVWDVTESIYLKASNHVIRLKFSTWDTAGDGNTPSYLPEPFLSFAKAYMRYQHAMRPAKNIGVRIAALRVLESALSENGGHPRPSLITSETLNRAAQRIPERFSDIAAYRVGGQLEMVADFLASKRLMATPILWRNPVRRPRDTARVGKEFDEKRQDKLPSPTALEALAKVFQLAREPGDVFVSSIAAILCSAPDRINEVLHLEANCEVKDKVPSTGAVAYGLRFRASKGGDAMVKWIVGSMGSVVERALINLRSLTEEARTVARWYEANPRKLYLPQRLEHMRSKEWLSLKEIGEVLFVSPPSRGSANDWCRENKIQLTQNETISVRKKGHKELFAAFADVERAVLGMLPRGFPIANKETGLKYSDALCLIHRNQLGLQRGTYRSVIYMPGHTDIAGRLGAHSLHGKKSMFDRFGLVEEDGSPIQIRTHQLRHYLNTLAQAGGLSQLDIAKWSGRVEISQNAAYDHQSDSDVIAQYREISGDQNNALSPLQSARKLTLIPRDQFGRLKLATAHTTDYGYCTHDYSMLPCQLHRDCLNCTEEVCIKGEAEKEKNLRRLVTETRALLADAQAADAKGYVGANRWVEHQKLTLYRAEQLCEIYDDPSIPDGTAIQLSGIVPASRLVQSAETRLLTRQKALAAPVESMRQPLVRHGG